jgi:hypothetical protein
LEDAKKEQEEREADKDKWIVKDIEEHNAMAIEMERMELSAHRAYMRNIWQENYKVEFYQSLHHLVYDFLITVIRTSSAPADRSHTGREAARTYRCQLLRSLGTQRLHIADHLSIISHKPNLTLSL